MWDWVYYVIVALSTAYQITEAKKARKRAKEAAEARKGFEFVVEGTVVKLPVPYGRFKVGGVRVWHGVGNSFRYVATNADKSFTAGTDDLVGSSYTVLTPNPNGIGYTSSVQFYTGLQGSKLLRDIEGTKNEFLYVQQALCVGPIHRIYDFIINESIGLDDPILGTSTTIEAGWLDNPFVAAGLRVDIHNGATAVDDAIFTKNHPSRSTAKFPNVTSASIVIKLDREDPQFSGVPDFQFIGEGIVCKTVTAGVLSGGRTYTNNPAWCLLDYLLSDVYGRGLDPSKVDLASFEAAAAICNTVVATVPVGGRIWKPADNYRNVSTRSLPLYECNVLLDTDKPIRENVETILSTMGDARLVWSQGKYRLLLQYPASNAAISYAGEITDDDIVMGEDVDIEWPSSSERLNYATVKFKNESIDFKEDSVSWPAKNGGTYLVGINGVNYAQASGGWEDKFNGGRLLNTYGVWEGLSPSIAFAWKFAAKTTGTHTLSFAADDLSTVVVKGNTYNSLHWEDVITATFHANANEVVLITVTATNSPAPDPNLKGFAGKVVDSLGAVVWNSRSPAYTDFVTVDQTALKVAYDAMHLEDHYVDLETDTFAEGVCDYHHAMAKAEELVRTSRSAFSIRFKYIVKNKFYEPGDFVKLNSATLQFADLPLRVNEVKMLEDGTAEITCARFDYTQLAWNVPDDYYPKTDSAYNFDIGQPRFVSLSNVGLSAAKSSGKVDWGLVSDAGVNGYTIYVSETGDVDSSNRPRFVEAGKAKLPPFELPELGISTGFVGVRANTATSFSEMTISDAVIFNTRSLKLKSSSVGFFQDQNNVFDPPSITLTATVTGYDAANIRWYKNGVRVDNPPGTPVTALTLVVSPMTVGTIDEYEFVIYETGHQSDTELAETIQLVSMQSATKTGYAYAYKRSATTLPPSDGPGEVTFDFATGKISLPLTLANGWYKEIPAGDEALWVVVASAVNNGPVDIITEPEWSEPVLFSSSGLNVATAYLYQRTDTDAPPPMGGTTPANDLVFTFATGLMSGTPPTGWSTTIPITDEKWLWISTATAVGMNATDTILGDSWSPARKLAKDGDAGTAAAYARLSASREYFVFVDEAATTSTDSDITLTLATQNVSGDPVWTAEAFSDADASLSTSVTLGGAANATVRTLTAAEFTDSGTLATSYMVITATVGGLTEELIIFRLSTGSAKITAILSNPTHFFQANSKGLVIQYVNSGTEIRVYEGSALLDYDGIGTTDGKWTVAAVPTNISVGTFSPVGSYLEVGDHNSITAATASIAYNISGKSLAGVAFIRPKTQLFAKSVAGGAKYSLTITIFKASATKPSNPCGGSYIFEGDVFEAPTGWSRAVPDGGGLPIWSSSHLFTSDDLTAKIPGPTCSPGFPYWEDITLPTGANIISAAAGNDRIVAVNGITPFQTLVSTDKGKTWTYHNTGINTSGYGGKISYGKGLFFAQINSVLHLTSADGITWTSFSHTGVGGNGFAAFLNDYFYAFDTGGGGYYYKTVDGLTVTYGSVDPAAASITSAAYVGSKYFAVSTVAAVRRLYHSDDGITWSACTVSPTDGFDATLIFAYFKGKYFFSNTATSPNYIWSSTDGVAFTNRVAAPNTSGSTWAAMFVEGERLYAIPSPDNNYSPPYSIAYTEDGISWFTGPALHSIGYWTSQRRACAVYDRGSFVAFIQASGQVMVKRSDSLAEGDNVILKMAFDDDPTDGPIRATGLRTLEIPLTPYHTISTNGGVFGGKGLVSSKMMPNAPGVNLPFLKVNGEYTLDWWSRCMSIDNYSMAPMLIDFSSYRVGPSGASGTLYNWIGPGGGYESYTFSGPSIFNNVHFEVSFTATHVIVRLDGIERLRYATTRASGGAYLRFGTPYDSVMQDRPVYRDCVRIRAGITHAADFTPPTDFEDPPVSTTGWPVPVMIGGGTAQLSLSADIALFIFTAANVQNPINQVSTITAALVGGLTGIPTFSAILYNISNVNIGAGVLGGSGLTRTLNSDQLTAAEYCVVTATLGGKTDSVRIGKIKGAKEPITGSLTNSSTTVNADAIGNVVSFATAGGTFNVLDGVISKTGNAAVTYSVQGTTGGLSISILPSGVYSVAVLTSDRGTATLRAVYDGVTIDLVYDITKVKAAPAILELTKTSVTLSADLLGSVANYSTAKTYATVKEGITDVTASYTLSKTDGPGVTSTLSDRLISVTNVVSNTGYVDIQATRPSYPTLTGRFTLAKARDASSYSGIISGQLYSAYDPVGVVNNIGVKVKNDGTIAKTHNGVELGELGRWYATPGAGVGDSLFIRFQWLEYDTFSDHPTWSTWLPFTSDYEVEIDGMVITHAYGSYELATYVDPVYTVVGYGHYVLDSVLAWYDLP